MHLLDGTAEDVAKDYVTIRKELELYNEKLKNKPEVVALNKCDALTDDEIKEKIIALKKVSSNPIFAISAVAGKDLNLCLNEVAKYVTRVKKSESEAEAIIEAPSKPWSPLG